MFVHSIEEIKCLRALWDSFSREWKVVLKSNIFNWFNEEQYKIWTRNYDYNNIRTENWEEEPWYNHEYILTDEELQKIFRIKYLSTVIGDATPWGGSEYTPNIDLSILRFFNNLEYLDISCFASGEFNEWIAKCPVLPCIGYLRCSFDNIRDISFIPKLFPNVRVIICTDNSIDNIDALNCLKIMALDCRDNKLSRESIVRFYKYHPFCIVDHNFDNGIKIGDTFELNK